MMYVTRREEFCASHRLHNPDWSEERNREVFDKCNNPHGHGHNYVVEVVVAGEVDPDTGYVVDLKRLKRVIREEVVERFDHKHLNYDCPEFADLVPTAENIARVIWVLLEEKIPAGKLHCVRLYETERNIVEYRGA